MLQHLRRCAECICEQGMELQQPGTDRAGVSQFTSKISSESNSNTQCVEEGWSDKLKDQAAEGCNIAGSIRVSKVIGNLHLSPGRSFQTNYRNIHDLVPYLRDGNQHDFGHTIYDLSFTGDDEYDFNKAQKSKEMKRKLGIASNPLDRTTMKV